MHHLLLHFTRSDDADDQYASRRGRVEYQVHGDMGTVATATLDWNKALLDDLARLHTPNPGDSVLRQIGNCMRRFLNQAGWSRHEREIKQAVQARKAVVITIRSNAAELYALPWELVSLGATPKRLGELPGLLTHYTWPGIAPRLEPDGTPEVDRVLLVCSNSGGAVPLKEHREAIARACQRNPRRTLFDRQRDVLQNVSPKCLVDALEDAGAGRRGAPVSILHVLCHGTSLGTDHEQVHGLSWHDDRGRQDFISPDRLRSLLSQEFARPIRLLVLATCDSSNPGKLRNQVGSLAQAAHQAGIPVVIGSRFPLSVQGSTLMTKELYDALLGRSCSPGDAFLAARRRLLAASDKLDWASIQLHGDQSIVVATDPRSRRPSEPRSATAPTRTRASSAVQDVAVVNHARALVEELAEVERVYVPLGGEAQGPSPTESPSVLIPSSFRVALDPEDAEDRSFSSIDEILEHYPRIALLGDPGAGKTTTLRHLQVATARATAEAGEGRLPLLINLAEWPEDVDTLNAFIARERTHQGLPAIPLERVLLLLDGLNEVAPGHYPARFAAIEQWLERHRSVRVIIASRGRHYRQSSARLPLPTAMLHPLGDTQIEQFVENSLGPERMFDFLDQLDWSKRGAKDHRHISHLARNPFQLALMCYLYQHNRRGIPGSQSLLMRRLVATLYDREDKLGHTHGITCAEMLDALGYLALAMTQGKFSTAVDKAWAVKQLPGDLGIDQLLDLGMQASLLRLSKEKRFIQFRHHLLQEYFAAERLSGNVTQVGSIIGPPRFERGGRVEGAFDEVCFLLVGFDDPKPASDDPGQAIVEMARADPFLAVQALGHVSERTRTLPGVEEHLVSSLVERLERPSRGGRDTGALHAVEHHLVELGASSVPALVSLQRRTRNKKVRRVAVRTLGAIGGQDALLALFDVLDDDYKWVRKEASDAIVALALQDPERFARDVSRMDGSFAGGTRRISAEQVLEVIEKTAPEALASLVSTEPFASAASQPIERLVSDLRRGEQEATQAMELLARYGEPAIPLLTEMLASHDTKDRAAAARTLARLGSDRVVAPLVAVARLDDGARRIDAEQILEIIETTSPEALAFLVSTEPFASAASRRIERFVSDLLRGEPEAMQATELLARYGELAIPLLALHDMIDRAVRNLARLGSDRVVAPLVAVARDRRLPIPVRRLATLAIARFGSAAAHEGLTSLLRDEDPVTAADAQWALRGTEENASTEEPTLVSSDSFELDKREGVPSEVITQVEDAVAALATAPKGPEQWIAHAASLGRAAVPALAQALGHPSHAVRSYIPRVLAKIGDKRAIVPLLVALDDSNGMVRHHAMRALAALGDVTLVPYATARLSDSNPNVRTDALRALGAWVGEQAMPYGLAALADPVTQNRRSAFKLLRHLGNRTHVKLVLPLFTDSRQQVRAYAAQLAFDWDPAAAIDAYLEFLQADDLTVAMVLPRVFWLVKQLARCASGTPVKWLGRPRVPESVITAFHRRRALLKDRLRALQERALPDDSRTRVEEILALLQATTAQT